MKERKEVSWKTPEDFYAWLGAAEVGEVAVYAKAVRHLGVETPSEVRRAIRHAAEDMEIFVQQRPLPPARPGYPRRWDYEVVRLSRLAGRRLTLFGQA